MRVKKLARHRRTITLAVLALLVVVAKVGRVPHPDYIWGLGIAMIGQALRLWASGHLCKDESLTMTGPFAYTRNPLYLGSFLIGVGECVMSGVWIALPIFLILFRLVYYPVVLEEERHLTEIFADDYREFQRHVPRWFSFRRRDASHWDPPRKAARFSFRRAMINREYEAIIGNSMIALVLEL